MVQYKWFYVHPATGREEEYDAMNSEFLQAAFDADEKECELFLEASGSFKVCFATMRQTGSHSGPRIVVKRAQHASPAELSEEDYKKAICICEGFESQIDGILADPGNASLAVPTLGNKERDRLMGICQEILSSFRDTAFQDKYHANPRDLDLLDAQPGTRVPSYFANAKDGSIYLRKVLAILGLRNLILRGGEIFSEMQATRFSGNPLDYGDREGPNKMKYFTGNAVDTDTIVVDCNNRSLLAGAFGKTFASSSDLSGSPEVETYVKARAKEIIDDFRKLFRIELDDEEAKARKVFFVVDSSPIPVSHNNHDRGHLPVWHYVNVGQDSYHVNVPEMADVVGALLRSPFGMVKAWATVRLTGGDVGSFFEDCIADSCFNGKWKAIEAFNKSLETQNSIFVVLGKLQQDNQSRFLPTFTDQEELDAMMDLIVAQSGAVGADAAGTVRAITRDDVAKWQRISVSGVMEPF